MSTNDILLSHGSGVVCKNLIVGLLSGYSLDSHFDAFDLANGKVLKGTTDSSLVGTTGARTSITISTGSGGSHVGSADLAMGDRGGGGGGAHSAPWSRNDDSKGGHSGHVINVDYVPKLAEFRLIKAKKNTLLPDGAVLFGDQVSDYQQALISFNQGFLAASETTTVTESIMTCSATTAVSALHHHLKPDWDGGVINLSGPSDADNQLGSHVHDGGAAVVTENLYKAYVRAYRVISRTRIRGLWGLWMEDYIPAGWELIGIVNNRYFQFTGDNLLLGRQGGDGTIGITGTTGGYSHRHYGEGNNNYNWSEYQRHASYESHQHPYSDDVPYEPDHFYIRALRKI